MAITYVNYCLLRDLLERGLLPQGGALLEIGEANVYGDELDEELPRDIRRLVADPARREALLELAATGKDLLPHTGVAQQLQQHAQRLCQRHHRRHPLREVGATARGIPPIN